MSRLVLVVALAWLAGCSHLVVLHDPLAAPEHNDLGVAYETAGKLDLAAREYRRALRIDPRFARARVNLGNLDAAAGNWPRAEHRYRKALRDLPADVMARNNLAIALLRRRHHLEEAEWLARSALALAGERDSIPRATLAEILEARRRQ